PRRLKPAPTSDLGRFNCYSPLEYSDRREQRLSALEHAGTSAEYPVCSERNRYGCGCDGARSGRRSERTRGRSIGWSGASAFIPCRLHCVWIRRKYCGPVLAENSLVGFLLRVQLSSLGQRRRLFYRLDVLDWLRRPRARLVHRTGRV